jgi:hypothetical protein
MKSSQQQQQGSGGESRSMGKGIRQFFKGVTQILPTKKNSPQVLPCSTPPGLY